MALATQRHKGGSGVSGRLTIAAFLAEQEQAQRDAAEAALEAARAEAWKRFCEELGRIRQRALIHSFTQRRRRTFVQRLDRFFFG